MITQKLILPFLLVLITDGSALFHFLKDHKHQQSHEEVDHHNYHHHNNDHKHHHEEHKHHHEDHKHHHEDHKHHHENHKHHHENHKHHHEDHKHHHENHKHHHENHKHHHEDHKHHHENHKHHHEDHKHHHEDRPHQNHKFQGYIPQEEYKHREHKHEHKHHEYKPQQMHKHHEYDHYHHDYHHYHHGHEHKHHPEHKQHEDHKNDHNSHHDHGHHDHKHHEHYQEHKHQGQPHYEFKYGVRDPSTGDIKNQWEMRKGDEVQGEYSLVEADGTIRTVRYSAGKHTGFNAVVKKEGKAKHPTGVELMSKTKPTLTKPQANFHTIKPVHQEQERLDSKVKGSRIFADIDTSRLPYYNAADFPTNHKPVFSGIDEETNLLSLYKNYPVHKFHGNEASGFDYGISEYLTKRSYDLSKITDVLNASPTVDPIRAARGSFAMGR